jgi:hypothetical protein
LAGNRAVVRNAGTLLDVTYQAQIVPGWTLESRRACANAPINNAPRPAPFELALPAEGGRHDVETLPGRVA